MMHNSSTGKFPDNSITRIPCRIPSREQIGEFSREFRRTHESYTTYGDTVRFRNTRIREFLRSIRRIISSVTDISIEPGDIWFQFYREQEHHLVHTHGIEGTSGIVYLDTLGGTVFVNPDSRNTPESIGHWEPAVPDTLVLFPSWLPHYTLPHLEPNAIRCVASFNSSHVYYKL